jgi:hypothetical protein
MRRRWRRRVVMVTRAGRPWVTRNGSWTRVGRWRIVTRAGWPGVTGSGSLTRVGRRRMRRIRGVEGVIIVLDLILRGNEWHTKLLLVPLIKVCGEGRGWRWRGPGREGEDDLSRLHNEENPHVAGQSCDDAQTPRPPGCCTWRRRLEGPWPDE